MQTALLRFLLASLFTVTSSSGLGTMDRSVLSAYEVRHIKANNSVTIMIMAPLRPTTDAISFPVGQQYLDPAQGFVFPINPKPRKVLPMQLQTEQPEAAFIFELARLRDIASCERLQDRVKAIPRPGLVSCCVPAE